GVKREMGRRARARAEELAWPRVARQFEKFYEEMLRRRPIHGEHDDCSVTYSIATALDCKSPKYVGATPDLGTRLPCGSDYEYYANLARTAEYKWRWKSAIDHWDRCIELMPDDIRSGAIA